MRLALHACLFALASGSQLGHARPALRRIAVLRGGAAAPAPTAAPFELQPHAKSTAECLTHYGVNADQGLDAERVELLLNKHGKNELEQEKGPSALELFLSQFEDRLVQILLVVAALSYVLARIEGEANGWVEPAVILGILLLNAVVSTWQELSAQDALSALQKLQPDTARCLRGGVWQHAMAAQELVPGDIIELRVGDSVPADARLLALRSTTFSSDEGSLTGESATVSKVVEPVVADARIQDKKCMVFSGTVVSNGRALALVVGTGKATEIGRIQEGVTAAKAEEQKTPLAQKLDKFGNTLTLAIGAICLAVWLLSIPKFDQPAFGSRWRGALYYLKVAVALGVAAIPEGLPAVITLCLSLGTRRMAARNVVVRKLPSVETLGCTTVICTDKTGTLTTNQMTVTSLVTAERPPIKGGAAVLREYEVEGVSYAPVGSVRGLSPASLGGEGLKELAACAALCNDAEITYDEVERQYTRVGEPTEAALKVLVEKMGVPGAAPPANASAAANHYNALRSAPYQKLATLEFSRTRKSMSVVVKETRSGANKLFVKGAPEGLLPRCGWLRLSDGTTVRMTDAWRAKLKDQFTEMARRPLRCLALAVKDTNLGVLATLRDGQPPSRAASAVLQATDRFGQVESGLTFVGMVGIKDPARPEAAEAIARCRDAGIRVIMITGDSAPTASAISKDVNIFESGEPLDGRVFVGGEFFELPVERQTELLSTSNLVFCRAEPRDKQRLLKQLQDMGEVAAMTGDGVNDAPALQQAAIGIAMGIAGTEVSKQAADMVLADDNFATIVAAVEEGRSIYANMKAFINFLITCNIGEVMTVFIATLLGLPEVLGPLHLLWVNLVTDGPPATALGFNPPDPRLMKSTPRGRNDPLVTPYTLLRYVVTGGYVGLATVGAFLHYYLRAGVPISKVRDWARCSTWEAGALTSFASDACDAFDPAKGKLGASATALTTLVVMEMLRAMCAVSETESLLQKPPWANRWLLLGVTLPVVLHLGVMYHPAIAPMLQLAPLTKQDWISVAWFAGPLVLLEEVLKLGAKAFRDY